jgi:hypothetical protein
MNNEIIMDNPKDKKILIQRLIASLCVFVIITSFVLWRFTSWSITTFLIMTVVIILCSSFPFLTAWRSEYLWRPYSVEIREDGLLLHRYYHKEPRLVSWEQIISFYAPPGDPAKQTKHYSQDGDFWVWKQSKEGKKEMILVNWRIAIAARERYMEKMGHYPPLKLKDAPDN